MSGLAGNRTLFAHGEDAWQQVRIQKLETMSCHYVAEI